MERQSGDSAAAPDGIDELSQRLSAALLQQASKGDGFHIPDPGMVARSLAALGAALARHPERLAARQAALAEMEELRRRQLDRAAGKPAAPLIEPEPSDRRFRDEAWSTDRALDS